MSKKIAPLNLKLLSDESISAQATFLSIIDTLDEAVTAIEGCKNAAERATAIECIREQIALLRNGYQLTSDISYLVTHEKGRTAAARKGGKEKAALAHLLCDYYERTWDTQPFEGRLTQEAWVKHHVTKFLKIHGIEATPAVLKRAKRLLNPSARPVR